MAQEEVIKQFEANKIRVVWDGEKEKYYFSIVDVIEALTDTDRPRKYWNDLKSKLKKEGSELSEKIGQLKMQASSPPCRLMKRNPILIRKKTNTLAKFSARQQPKT